MAFPAQAVERMVQDSARTPGWSGRLLMFSATLFMTSVFAYLGLVYGYAPYLQKQADTLNVQAKALTQQVQADNQTKIVEFYSQLANLRSILDKHAYSSALLELLEKSTYANVYFTKLSFTASNNQVALAGLARTAQDVPAQIQIFQTTPGIRNVTFNNLVALPGGQWQFDATLTLDPAVLASVAPVPATSSPVSAPAAQPVSASTTAP